MAHSATSGGGRGVVVSPAPFELEVRAVGVEEVAALGPVDVSEEGSVVYVVADDVLLPSQEAWRRPRWSEPAWREWLDVVCATLAPDIWLGAFHGDSLAGLASVRFRLDSTRTAQLTTLHVDRLYRRQGVGERLLRAAFRLAVEQGAIAMYVSATPSQSAVSFYRRHGFELTPEPDPRLLALEPEDIHMVCPLVDASHAARS